MVIEISLNTISKIIQCFAAEARFQILESQEGVQDSNLWRTPSFMHLGSFNIHMHSIDAGLRVKGDHFWEPYQGDSLDICKLASESVILDSVSKK